MTALDSDGNGEISPEEIKGAVAALKKLDKNKDGKLTEDELRPNFGGRGGASGQRPSRGGEGRGGQRPSGRSVKVAAVSVRVGPHPVNKFLY